jgi:hypothetical protein
MFTEVDSVSQDGKTLIQMMKDTTEAETVTIETQSHRVEGGPADSQAISGTWRAFKASRSLNGSLIKYTCTKDSFSAETPLGERYTAKFDGNFYPVEDDPGHTMVSAKLLNARTVELTSKRKFQKQPFAILSQKSARLAFLGEPPARKNRGRECFHASW